MRILSSKPSLGVLLLVSLLAAGCSGGGSSDSRLRLLRFNLDGVTNVFLNEPLIFDFSAPIAPDSVDVNTIQIRFDASKLDVDGDCFPDESGNDSMIVDGEFFVEGSRVTFQPRLPTTRDNEVGLFPAHDIASDPRPEECIRDTRLDLVYLVNLPGFSEDNLVTVVTKNDRKPLVEGFSSSFTTVFDSSFPPEIDPASFRDPVRGSPRFDALLDPAPGATQVSRDSVVRVRFTEPFVPSSVNPDTLFLAVVGPNSGRKQKVAATYEIDPVFGEITFVPTIGLPAGLEVSVEYTEGLIDFGGNPLVVPEGVLFPSFTTVDAPPSGPFRFREDFDDEIQADFAETSALWNPPSDPGMLVAGEAGGIASHAELLLDPPSPQTFTLDTGAFDPAEPFPSFDYSSVFVGRNATVRAVGENPLVIKSVRDIVIDGTIDVSGADAASVPVDGTSGTPGASGVAGGGSGGNGGTAAGESGTDGLGPRVFGDPGPRHPGGGRGSVALDCPDNGETGGGGGGEYAGGATDGRGDAGNSEGGGAAGMTYGDRDLQPFAGFFVAGSGAGGAGSTCFNGRLYPGTGGGAGGGALWLQAGEDLLVRGQLLSLGGRGGDNLRSNGSAGGATGGGGSGGALLLQGLDLVQNTISSSITATRGIAGQPSESGAGDNGRGGSGGRGRIRIEARTTDDLDLTNIVISPNPRRGEYDRGGNSTAGTSIWFDTRAHFPDYTFAIGSRNGGPGDQDNANLFPEPAKAVRYLFQGASTDPDNPIRPNLDDLRPGFGRFTEHIDEVDDSRFIRVKVVLTYPFPDIGLLPRSSFFDIGYTFRGEARF